MTRCQTSLPRQWLIVTARSAGLPRHLPRTTGIIVLAEVPRRERIRIAIAARRRELIVAEEATRDVARIHNVRELRRARLARTPLILLSPLYPTRSHPDWRPLPRMRAAALARLAGKRAFALGGMNARRFQHVKRLGLVGWAGIDAWSKPRS